MLNLALLALGAFWIYTTLRMYIPLPRIIAPWIVFATATVLPLAPAWVRLGAAASGVVALLVTHVAREDAPALITHRSRREKIARMR